MNFRVIVSTAVAAAAVCGVGVAAKVPAPTAAAVHKIEGDLRGSLITSKVERNAGFTIDGAKVFTSTGTASRSTFTFEQGTAIRGGVLTHSHPTSNSFSGNDLKLARKWQLVELRAVTAVGTYVLGPPIDGWNSVDADVFDLRVGQLLPGDKSVRTDPAILRLALEFHFHYRFEPRNSRFDPQLCQDLTR